MVTAEELVVSIVSEGTQETQDDLEGVESTMGDTADSAGDSADELEGFSKRFSGALSAAVSALAVGAAGLLSQVPVIGELMSGLFAIVEALAFQMDSVLRPVLSPLTDQMFEWANAIFEADGALGTFIGVLTTVVSVAAIFLATVGALAKTFAVVASTVGTVVAVFTKLAGAALFVVSLLEPISTAILIIIGVLALLSAAWANNWLGIRDITDDVLSWIRDTVIGGFLDLVSGALDALSDFGSGVRSALTDVAARFTEWAGDLAGRAFAWGRGILTRFISGIESMLGALRDVLDDLPFIGRILDLFDRLSDAIGDLDFESDISASVGGTIFGEGGGGGGSGGGASGRPRFGAGGGASTGGQQIDGRQISESTGRYRSDPANRRGI